MDRGLYEERPVRRIDYDRMNREYPKLKAARTRARNSGDPLKVLAAVERFVTVSDEVGAMPDDWSGWRNDLEDAFYAWSRTEAADDDYFEGGGKLLTRWRDCARRFDF